MDRFYPNIAVIVQPVVSTQTDWIWPGHKKFTSFHSDVGRNRLHMTARSGLQLAIIYLEIPRDWIRLFHLPVTPPLSNGKIRQQVLLELLEKGSKGLQILLLHLQRRAGISNSNWSPTTSGRNQDLNQLITLGITKQQILKFSCLSVANPKP